MKISQYPSFCPLSYSNETNLNNNKQENIGVIAFHPFNQLMIKITIKQQANSP